MRQPCLIVAVGLCLAVAALRCNAFDTVKTSSGILSGKVTAMSPMSVTLTTRSNETKVVPINAVESIFFDKEPSQLKTARVSVSESQYDDALSSLEKIDIAKVDRKVVGQEIDFYKALCRTKLALAGAGSASDAKKAIVAFRDANPGNFHYLEATELLAQLSMTLGEYKEAEGLFTKLVRATSRWPEFRMRSAVGTGYSQLAQDRPVDARRVFTFALGIGALDRNQELAAKLGLARCDAAENQPAKAVAAVRDILSKADPEDVELQAKAFNTLGSAYRQAGNAKDALWAFLHVDVIYFGDQESHAEALLNLEDLWNAVGKPDKAARARKVLDTRYKGSRWAKAKLPPVVKPKPVPAVKPKAAPATKPGTAPAAKRKTAPAAKPKTAPAAKPKTAPAATAPAKSR